MNNGGCSIKKKDVSFFSSAQVVREDPSIKLTESNRLYGRPGSAYLMNTQSLVERQYTDSKMVRIKAFCFCNNKNRHWNHNNPPQMNVIKKYIYSYN